MLFKTGMVEEEISGIFKFGDKSFFKISDQFEEFFGGVPGIEEDGLKGDVCLKGFEDEITGELDFGSEARVFVPSRELGFGFIEFDMEREIFIERGKAGGDKDVTDFFAL